MSFRKYYVYEVLSSPSPIDDHESSFMEVRSTNDTGEESEDFLFSDEHELEDVEIGYWYLIQEESCL